jgi:cytochrome c
VTADSYHRLRGAGSCAAAGLLLALASTTALANRALAEKNGCLGCHAAAVKLVGPAYQEVAARYAGKADAVATVAQHIRAGGSGQWGDVPMPPQAQLSEADATKLARWILGGAK